MDIVVCSNNSAIVEMASRAFRKEGHRSMTCESGLEALGLIGVLHCDLLVLDLETPGIGSLLLISAIKELAPAVPVLAVSTEAGADTRALAEKGVPYVRLDPDADSDGAALLAEIMRCGLSAPGYARQMS